MTQELQTYVQEQIAQGVDKEHLRKSLAEIGWNQSQINMALDSATSVVPMPSQQSHSDARAVAPPTHKNILGIIVVFLFIAAVGAGGVFAYTKFRTPSPRDVLKKMTATMSTVQTSSFDVTVSYSSVGSILQSILLATTELKGEDFLEENPFPFPVADSQVASGLVTELAVRLKGRSDFTDIYKSIADMVLEVEVKTPIRYGPVQLAIRTLKDATYIKATNLAPIMFFDLSSLSDIWITFNFDDVANEFRPVYPLYFDGSGSVSPPSVDEEKKELTTEQKTQLRQLLFQPDLFIITDTLSSEKVHGVNTYHYAYTIDKEKAFAALIEAEKVWNPLRGDLLYEGLDDTEQKDIVEVVEIGKKIIDSISGELWIGKKDSYLHKSTTNLSLKGYGAEVTLSIVSEQDNFNEPVTVEAPTSFSTIEEVFSKLDASTGLVSETDTAFGTDSFASNNLDAPQENHLEMLGVMYPEELTEDQKSAIENFDLFTIRQDSDGDGISDMDEAVVYHTNPNSEDTDGDGYGDYLELENMKNPRGEGELDVRGLWPPKSPSAN